MKEPIFIVGTGRCGSTIFFRLLGHHPDLCWHSTLENKKPGSSFVRGLSRFLNRDPYYSWLSGISNSFKPAEIWNIWEKADPDFVEPPTPPGAEDVTAENKKRFREIVSEKVKRSKGDRFVGKLTGWSRIPYLKEIFPDARFVHVLRDGRAVANSLVNFEGWKGWDGPKEWRWGYDEEYVQVWEKYDRSFPVLAGLEWKILVEEIERAGGGLDEGEFIRVKYEGLAEDTLGEVRRVLENLGVDVPERFVKKVRRYDVENRNYKWKKNLSEEEKKKLNDFLENELEKYGYVERS